MTLIAFTPILWGLSEKVEIDFLKNIPGSLVWIAFATSLGSLLISWFVGIKLPGLEYNNQKVEAKFRKELVYGEDDRDNYAKPDTVFQLFTGIKFNYHRLFLHYGYFDIWINIYDQFYGDSSLSCYGSRFIYRGYYTWFCNSSIKCFFQSS